MELTIKYEKHNTSTWNSKKWSKGGVISSIFAQTVRVNLNYAGEISGTYLDGSRYGKGEVGEILLIEGQQSIVLGRLIEVKLPERDRGEISGELHKNYKVDAVGVIQLLGTMNPSNFRIDSGIKSYPRLGDRVYSAPLDFISLIPELINKGLVSDEEERVGIVLGNISGGSTSIVTVEPDKLLEDIAPFLVLLEEEKAGQQLNW